MPAPPSSSASVAARLPAVTSPLGGTGVAIRSGTGGARAAGGAPAAVPGFAGLLAKQIEKLQPLVGAGDLGGSAGAAGAAFSATVGGGTSSRLARAAAGAARGAGNTIAAAVPAAGKKAKAAVAWAKSMVGRQDWNNLCQRFVEEAYGTRGVYPTAADAADKTVTRRGKGSWRAAPVGALLYFAPDETNGFNGHSGIYLGNGRMVSARPTGVQEERLDTPYNERLFAGWGEPKRLPGRQA